MRLSPATTWEGCDEPMGADPGLATRISGLYRDRIGRDPDRRPLSGRNDLRYVTRRGQEGPGRAEGRDSGRCEPQGEGGGRDVRPRTGDGPADDRGRGSSRIPCIAEDFTAFSSASDDPLKRQVFGGKVKRCPLALLLLALWCPLRQLPTAPAPGTEAIIGVGISWENGG